MLIGCSGFSVFYSWPDPNLVKEEWMFGVAMSKRMVMARFWSFIFPSMTHTNIYVFPHRNFFIWQSKGYKNIYYVKCYKQNTFYTSFFFKLVYFFFKILTRISKSQWICLTCVLTLTLAIQNVMKCIYLYIYIIFIIHTIFVLSNWIFSTISHDSYVLFEFKVNGITRL